MYTPMALPHTAHATCVSHIHDSAEIQTIYAIGDRIGRLGVPCHQPATMRARESEMVPCAHKTSNQMQHERDATNRARDTRRRDRARASSAWAVPRTRPSCSALPLRTHELRATAQSRQEHGPQLRAYQGCASPPSPSERERSSARRETVTEEGTERERNGAPRGKNLLGSRTRRPPPEYSRRSNPRSSRRSSRLTSVHCYEIRALCCIPSAAHSQLENDRRHVPHLERAHCICRVHRCR